MATKHTDTGATTGCEAELWAMADALGGSMDAAEASSIHQRRGALMDQRRHLIAHRMGVVDEDYVSNPADREAA